MRSLHRRICRWSGMCTGPIYRRKPRAVAMVAVVAMFIRLLRTRVLMPRPQDTMVDQRVWQPHILQFPLRTRSLRRRSCVAGLPAGSRCGKAGAMLVRWRGNIGEDQVMSPQRKSAMILFVTSMTCDIPDADVFCA